MSRTLSLTINGETVQADVPDHRLLVDFLRRDRGLTGTHVACDTSQCGACTVHLNGEPIKACTIFTVQCEGADILTIEGLAEDGQLHPMQQAFQDHHGLQCGFCTPGMVMAALGIVARHGPNPSRESIREDLEGNLCRCTGYQNIVLAIEAGAKAMSQTG